MTAEAENKDMQNTGRKWAGRALIVLLGLVAGGAGAAEIRKLAPGVQRAYDTSRVLTRAAVGDPEVAGIAVVGPREYLLTGKKFGRTTLLIWEKGRRDPRSYDVVVEPEGIALQSSLRIARLAENKLVSGAAGSLEEHARMRALASEGDKPPIDASKSAFENQVQINIKIVEVSRSRLMSAGVFLGRNQNGNLVSVAGPGVLTGAQSSTGTSGGLTGSGFTLNSASGFLPKANAFNLVLGNSGAGLLNTLSLLESNGFAYTLATPTLSVLSGQSASFLAGGELPIPLRSGSGADSSISINYREFGVKLQVTATVLDANRIVLKVAPEVSEPDPSLAVSTGGVSVPGFVVRRSDTTLMLGDGESFVIGGLFSRNIGNIVDKFPGLGDIPILGAFFRSKNLDTRDKELLMVVTTHLVKPVAAGTALPALPGEQYRAYNPDFGNYLLDSGVVGEARLPVGVSE